MVCCLLLDSPLNMENSEKDVVNGVQGCTVDLFGIPIPTFI